jgi:hypothetical protein
MSRYAAALLVLLAPIAPASAQVAAPTLKWQRGGCLSSFCQTGWYASPAVADLDNDGQLDVIWASYDLVAVNGATGALKWRQTHAQRSWPGVAVGDLTGDGTLEIVVGRNSNILMVHQANGTPLWTRTAFPNQSGEVRTLAVGDLDGNGSLEIVVGRASGGSFNQLNVFDAAGNIRPGWPARRDTESGFGWGMYNNNVAIGDMNGDGNMEVIGPTDTHYITALDRDGNQLPTASLYNTFNPVGPKVWSRVGVHVDQAADLRGYANCGTEHRPNFANSAPVIADVDGDGSLEIVVVGDVYNCALGDPDGDLYHLPFILKLDRTRWTGSGFDWTVIPAAAPGSGPLSQDYFVIQNSVQNPVVADLDGDGRKEILYSSYDGRVHAYWLDKTQHGSWPYKVPGTGFRFAGEPVVVDLNNDGKAEVIFTSWPENGGNRLGQLHVLDFNGNSLHAINLPAAFGDDWNGGLGAPTLANLDADPDLELVFGTNASGLVAYDLPGSSGARVLWGTGRGGILRSGTAPVISSGPAGALPAMHVRGDLGGDGRDDIVWRKVGAGVDKGAMFLWTMNGTGLLGARYLDPISEDWQVQGLGDFDGDGKDDVLWRNFGTGPDAGKLYIWMMDGPNVVAGTGYTASQADLGWRVDGVGDLNGDGKSDIVWRKTGAGVDKGAMFLWTMNGTGIAGARYLDPISEDWQVVALGDFNGDGTADVLWRNLAAGADSGKLYVWMMSGPNVVAGTGYTAAQADLGWRIDGVGDLNGDGRVDIVWRKTAAGVDKGALFLWTMNGTGLSGSRYLDPIGEDWQVQGVGDFNGDGKRDILWRNQGPGADIGKLYVWIMDGPNVVAGTGYTASQADLGWRVDSPRR